MTEKTEDLIELDRLRLATEDAAGGPPSVEQVEALIDLVDALEARLAALTTPQEEDARERLHAMCDCVPDLGPAHCHLCGNEKGKPVPWPECSAVRAAFPRLGRDIAGEIEAEIADGSRRLYNAPDYYHGLDRAVEIVRNGR